MQVGRPGHPSSVATEEKKRFIVKDIDRIFRPVKFEFGQVHIAGGHTTTPASAKSRTVEGSGKKQHIFVNMAGTEHLLVTSVCGGAGAG